jgi:predicted dehydrogenase
VDALLFLFGSLSAEKPGKGLSLPEAMDAGVLPSEALPPEFLDSGAAPPLVEVTASATLPGGIPLKLRASWVERQAADDFAIWVQGSKGRALLDLKKSRASIEIRPVSSTGSGDDNGDGVPSITRPGPAIASTYERFIQLIEAHIAGPRRALAGAVAAATAVDYPTFEQGLKVMRVLDSLIPGGLPK